MTRRPVPPNLEQAPQSPAGERFGVDRRAEPRRPTSLRGRIFYGHGDKLWADCTIRDLSTRGAKVEVAAVHDLTARVVLMNVSDGLAYEANLRWRRGDLAGLAFQKQHDLKGPLPEELASLHELYRALSPG